MVLFFSATGNTKRMANTIAAQLQDDTLDLLHRIKTGDYSAIESERPFVICAPIYVSELPVFFVDYLKRVPLKGSRDVYGIFTNGGYSGVAGGQLNRIVKKKQMQFKGYAEFKLASNHITNKSHKALDDAEIRERTKTALRKAETAAAGDPRGRHCGDHDPAVPGRGEKPL